MFLSSYPSYPPSHHLFRLPKASIGVHFPLKIAPGFAIKRQISRYFQIMCRKSLKCATCPVPDTQKSPIRAQYSPGLRRRRCTPPSCRKQQNHSLSDKGVIDGELGVGASPACRHYETAWVDLEVKHVPNPVEPFYTLVM